MRPGRGFHPKVAPGRQRRVDDRYQAPGRSNLSTGTHWRTRLTGRSPELPHDRERIYYREDFSRA
jgi:hypothetical protein